MSETKGNDLTPIDDGTKKGDKPNKVAKVGRGHLKGIGTPRTLNIDVYRDTERAIEFFNKLIGGKNIGVEDATEALGVYLQCQEMGLPFVTASNHIQVVKGKVGIDIHLVRAILLRPGSGVYWEKVLDYVPEYTYTDSVEQWTSCLTPRKFLEWLNDEYCGLYNKAAFVWSAEDAEKAKINKATHLLSTTTGTLTPSDYVTEYLFTRPVKIPLTNEIKIREVRQRFTYQDAVSAGLFDISKPDSAWVKYLKNQLDVRAFTFGARQIADDLLNGMYTTAEICDITGTDYDVDPEGNVVIQDVKHEDVSEDIGSANDVEPIQEAVIVNSTTSTDGTPAPNGD